MQHEAGLRLKCLGGRLAWGDCQFHLSTGQLNGRGMGLPVRSLYASSVERFTYPGSGEAATSAGGSSNGNLLISRAPTKAKSQEPAYSQALNQNDRQGSRSRESGRQTVRRLWWMVFGVETGR